MQHKTRTININHGCLFMWCVHFIKSPEPLMHMTINLLCHKVFGGIAVFICIFTVCVCVCAGGEPCVGDFRDVYSKEQKRGSYAARSLQRGKRLRGAREYVKA